MCDEGGGQHLIADNGFITAEMCFCEAAVKEKETLQKSVEEGGGGVETDCLWMDANKEEFETEKNVPIKMRDTSYSRYEADQKRNVVRACRKMTPKEREDLRRVINEMNTSAAANDADNNNEPATITPI